MGPRPSRSCSWSDGEQQLHLDPRAPEHDGLAPRAQEGEGRPAGQAGGARPGTRAAVEDGRVQHHHVLLARWARRCGR